MDIKNLIDEVFSIDEMAKSANPIFDSIKDNLKTYLKKEGIKYSVKTSHNKIDVYLLEGPIDFFGNYSGTNKSKTMQVYNIENSGVFTGKSLEVLKKVDNILKEKQKENSTNSDRQANYYTMLTIGDSGKPYNYTGK